MSAGAFSLTKWYLDGVDASGSAFIAYWARVSWHGLRVTWQRVTVYPAGGHPVERTSLRADPPPALADGTLRWRPVGLGCEVEACDGGVPGSSHRLLDDEDGALTWRCLLPAARVRLQVNGAAMVDGTGYAECLDLTRIPWHLPVDEVRWGRWVSAAADHAVTWVDWRGPHPVSLVLVDGVRAAGGAVSDDGVTWPGGQADFGAGRVLHHESVAAVVGRVPGLRQMLRRAPLAIRDTKWLSPVAREVSGEAPMPGWAIHEIVWMRSHTVPQ